MADETFTTEQQEIIDFNGRRCLVTAPGGCGKTAVLTQRVVNFLNDKKSKHRNLLCVTFTKGAADEMLTRIIEKCPDSSISSALNIGIDTLHAISRSLLNRDWSADGSKYSEGGEKYPVLTEQESKELIAKAFYNVMRKPNRTTKHVKTNSRYRLLEKYEMHPLSLICKSGERENVENLYYEAARKLYHTNRQLTFGMPDELLLYPEYKEGIAPQIRKKDQELIKDVADELGRLKSPSNGNELAPYKCDFDDLLCIIWDFLKSEKIPRYYDWVQVDEVQDLSALQLDIIRKLTKNDGKETVAYFGDINQAIFSFMGGCPENVLSIRDEVIAEGGEVFHLSINHRSSPKLMQYQRHFLNAFLPKMSDGTKVKSNLVSDKKDTEQYPVEIRRYPTDTKQNSEVVSMAASMLEDNPNKRIAILCRTNNECLKFENALIKKGIQPYRLSDETFYSMPGIHESIDELYSKFPSEFPEEIGIPAELKDIMQFGGRTLSVTDALFLRFAERMEASGLYATPEILLNAIRAATIEDADGCKLIKSGIILSTVHKAKGKSFDTVIVPSVVEGVFPFETSTRKKAILEDARVFYVAISRAETKLVLTYFEKGLIQYRKTEPLVKTCEKHKKAKVSVRTHMAVDKIKTKPSRFIMRPRGTLCLE